ncbi:Cytochrome P450 CYP527G1 [Metarhizium robertsii ARSEF 23]|uniref:Cytochrome P450 CYP527G1 n=1 Tax=Metarhizium robertsii (strain ARSEF 23 / ATCC MYA-3075) TaxID=655844 RepID=E9FCN8_METRA|nr:Cytochrome P450 CYP527G1 [Metarhizium robertsii ARSEF 23]EFY94494.1 Cytochrome P450 CYP527G1 [Metarhizium robertsii ARSEF 23]
MAILRFIQLDTTAVLNYAAVILVFWYIITSVITWKSLRHIPGPFLGKFSHFWSIYHQLAGDVGPVHLGLKKYNSPLVRTGPHYLVTTDPNIWKYVNAARSTYQRDMWWAAGRIDYQRPSLADTLDSASHDKMKAKVAGGYSGRDIDLEIIINEQIAKLVDAMRRKHVGKNMVDFADISRFFTLDVITRLAYGKEFGWVEADEDLYGYGAEISKFAALGALISDVTWLHPFVRWSFINSRFKPRPAASHGVGKVVGLGREQIRKRFAENQNDDRDMIGSFMRHGLTVNEIEDEALIQIFAGSDTTAIVIRSVMLHLIATPRVCVATNRCGNSRLKTNIKNAISSGEVSTPITLAQAQSLPYLQAVIWEGFRMRPAVTYGHYKVVPPGGDTIAGIRVPGGTAIGHNHYGMMRNEEIFGGDVDVFRPERYLDQPNGDEMQRTVELVFGTGRWMCVGKQVALMELNKIFWEFELQLANPAKPGWTETSSVTFTHRDMWIRITEAEDL